MEDKKSPGESITFLGTAGARIMVANQILASGGLWLNLSGTEILLDPRVKVITARDGMRFDLSQLGNS